ncbi:MAG TPA: hypothetical protein VKX46_21685 [Ktedonobacteraceae bacterium]|nr:hypothetical protein [Ktedonobacteraceae bacterium]
MFASLPLLDQALLAPPLSAVEGLFAIPSPRHVISLPLEPVALLVSLVAIMTDHQDFPGLALSLFYPEA